ncbi:MAG: hypothetical protein ABIR84_10620 [Candidatus Nitrotoga sp.]
MNAGLGVWNKRQRNDIEMGEKMRDESTDNMCEDMVQSNNLVIHTKTQGGAHVKHYDD